MSKQLALPMTYELSYVYCMLWIYPPPSNSHHQIYIFKMGSLYINYKPSFTTGILGAGVDPMINRTLYFDTTKRYRKYLG